MTGNHQEILQIIDKIRMAMSNEDEKTIEDGFNDLFGKDKEYFGGTYSSGDDFYILFEMLNVIADNHIRQHNTLTLAAHMPT